MLLYNALVEVGDFFLDLHTAFVEIAISVNDVYLLGEYLAIFFLDVAVYFSRVGTKFYMAADAWWDIYNDLKDGVPLPAILQTLIQWADDLISFIRNVEEWVSDAIKTYFPFGWRVLQDPVGEILDIIETQTGLNADILYDPLGWANDVIYNFLGGLVDLIDDPVEWMLDKIRLYFPDAWDFLHDPYEWLLIQIETSIPELSDFMQSPGEYITDKFMDFVENTLDRYRSRFVKLAEIILNKIF